MPIDSESNTNTDQIANDDAQFVLSIFIKIENKIGIVKIP